MTEIDNEHERFEQGLLGRDFISMAPESVALRALIDAIGLSLVVVVDNSPDTVENVSVDE